MLQTDLKTQLKSLYSPSSSAVTIVDVPPLNFLMVDGEGNPNTSEEYRQAVQALYSVAYTLTFMLRKEQRVNYPVMPLEGLWWAHDMREFGVERKEEWLWTMMIAQPEEVTPDLLDRALGEARRKKPTPALGKVRLETYREGRAAQIMHIGPYAAEGPTIARVHAYIRDQGFIFDGIRQKHHEIYLSDPRRAAPEKMRTIIRQPVEQGSEESV